jgi:hypothetical protein
MKQDNPFAKLGALDQKLYQETTPKPEIKPTNEEAVKEPEIKSQNAGIPEIQHSIMPENQKSSKLANQTSGKPEIQQTGKAKLLSNITATEKVTYRFHPEGKYAIEDMKTILTRKHGIKASLEEIAEESILMAYEDLLENQKSSKLANRLSSMPENQKSR